MADVISVIFSGLAFCFSIYAAFAAKRDKTTDVTLDVWKVWISKDYRRYRVLAYRAIKDIKDRVDSSHQPKLALLLEDQEIEEAIGSIEHLFFELDAAMSEGLINRKLFDSLFGRSATDWSVFLKGFDRTDGETFSDKELDATFGRLLARPEADGSQDRISAQ